MRPLQAPPLAQSIRWLLRGLLLLLGAAVLGLGWYGYKRGLTRSWREIVFREFRRHGVEVAFKKLTLDPFRGLVAREVTLFDTNDRLRVIAEMDQAALSIDLSRLANGRPFLTALELRDARLSLPLEADHAKGQRLEVENLNARLFFPDREIQVAQAEARVLGCRVRFQGWIANPGTLQATPTPEQGEPRWTRLVRPIIAELQALKPQAEAPRIDLKFSGDMNQPDSLRTSVHFTASEVSLHKVPLDSAEGTLVWQNQGWELQDLTLVDEQGGKLIASGRWETASQTHELSVESSLDPHALALAAGAPALLTDCRFRQRPSLQLHLRSHADSQFEPILTAHLRAPGFSRAHSGDFDLTASASARGSSWSLRNVELSGKSGFLKADLLRTHQPTRIRIESNLPKGPLQNLLGSEGLTALLELQHEPAETARLELGGTLPALLEKQAALPQTRPDWFAHLLPHPTPTPPSPQAPPSPPPTPAPPAPR